MLSTKRFFVGIVGVLLGTGLVAVGQQPSPLGQHPVQTAHYQGAPESGISQASFAERPGPFFTAHCETCEGYKCQVEAAPKKKTVYTWHCKPFCIPHRYGCTESCEECGRLAFKRVLVKKSIECGLETKCVPKPICPPCEEPKK